MLSSKIFLYSNNWPTIVQKVTKRFGITSFKVMDLDSWLYREKKESDIIFIGMCVYDIFVATTNEKLIEKTKCNVNKQFKMSVRGVICYCLGRQFRYDKIYQEIHISQKKYFVDLINKYGMKYCKLSSVEAAYMALIEAIFMEQFLKNIGTSLSPTHLRNVYLKIQLITHDPNTSIFDTISFVRFSIQVI